MMKNIVGLEVMIAEKAHIYMPASAASIAEIKEALFQFQKQVAFVEDQQKAAQEAATAKAAEEKPDVENKIVEIQTEV